MYPQIRLYGICVSRRGAVEIIQFIFVDRVISENNNNNRAEISLITYAAFQKDC